MNNDVLTAATVCELLDISDIEDQNIRKVAVRALIARVGKEVIRRAFIAINAQKGAGLHAFVADEVVVRRKIFRGRRLRPQTDNAA